MLSHIGTDHAKMEFSAKESLNTRSESRYNRNEEEYMQAAISYFYEFKKKLDKLHPQCTRLI